jgi:hypothetical protein
MTTRNGKIARLPKAIREEINQRLDDGATARSLVAWLNGLPAVQALVQSQFGGHEIREQNLSQWKLGGYQEWVRHRETLELAERLQERAEEMTAQDPAEKPRLPLSEVLSLWLSARYVVATQEVEAAAGGEDGWKKLRQMCGDVTKLRRSDQRQVQLQIEREKVELRREEVQIEQGRFTLEKEEKQASPPRKRSAGSNRIDSSSEGNGAESPQSEKPWPDWSDEERIAWARKPENLDRIKPPLTEEEQKARLRAIFGLPEPNLPRDGK